MKQIYKAVTILSFCLIIITGGIRLCLTPFFIDLEYNLPGFPEDKYGFSTEVRAEYAYQSVDYLLGKVSDAEFQALTLPDGQFLFNEREISHMQDVRDLTLIVLRIGYVALGITALGIFLAVKFHWKTYLLQAGSTAGLVLILFICLVILGVVINFNQLFTAFHSIFFEGDTWLFYTSDSLIRLFPTPFWVNIFIAIGLFTFVLALILYFTCSGILKQKQKEEV